MTRFLSLLLLVGNLSALAGCEGSLGGGRLILDEADLTALAADAGVRSGDAKGGEGRVIPPAGTGVLPNTDGGNGNNEVLLCKACSGPEHCGGAPNYCVTSNKTGESICAQDCSGGKACPPAYDCLELPLPTGGQAFQCLPQSGTCTKPPDIPPLAPGSCGNAEETEVLNLVNQIRNTNGLKPYACDATVAYTARKFSQYQCDANFFAHVGPDGRTPGQRLAAAGAIFYNWGENCTMAGPTAQAAVTSWMNSPGHKGLLLSPHFSHAGVGHIRCAKNSEHFWTMDFIAK
jgi:uncharacterized protein YkwD